ncbi:MAG: FAD-binding oxidoreductase [Gammaproteobacteria bacterium]|nr:FAD-binding oxidoreductase [Gammaproteobacteria bacterium]
MKVSKNISQAYMVLLFLLLPATSDLYATELRAFKSDGCSAFPNGTSGQNDLWLNCCIEHDKYYWVGGTYEERLNADQRLKRCVARSGEPAIAMLMLAAVRIAGTPFLPTSFRWGYGWPVYRGYKALSAEEVEAVNLQISQPGFD